MKEWLIERGMLERRLKSMGYDINTEIERKDNHVILLLMKDDEVIGGVDMGHDYEFYNNIKRLNELLSTLKRYRGD